MLVRRAARLAVYLALALTGCVSATEQKAADTKTCESQGNQQGTDGFAQCMQRITEARDRQRDQDMNAVQMQQSIMMAPNCPAGMCM